MSCEACCREFDSKGRRWDCPHCGFNNCPGWWPRTKDMAGRLAAERREKHLQKKQRARQRAERQRLGRQKVLAHA